MLVISCRRWPSQNSRHSSLFCRRSSRRNRTGDSGLDRGANTNMMSKWLCPARVQEGSGFRVQGSGFRVQGSGFRDYRGCRPPLEREGAWLWGSTFRVQDG